MKCEICEKHVDIWDFNSYHFGDKNGQLTMTCSTCSSKDKKIEKKKKPEVGKVLQHKSNAKSLDQNVEQLQNVLNKNDIQKESKTSIISYISLGCSILTLILFFNFKNPILILITIILALFAIIFQLSQSQIKEKQSQ
jgi:predicted RND superfamily exporter protein